jgi:hypothetical protein
MFVFTILIRMKIILVCAVCSVRDQRVLGEDEGVELLQFLQRNPR